MKANFKDYAYFSKNQIKGIFLLTSLVLCFFSLPLILSKFSVTQKTDFSKFEKEIIKFEETIENTAATELPATITLFDFDPNTISKEKLIDLGLSPIVANTFINFRRKGFKFREKEDLKKVYGIKETDYQRLLPYIKIPESSPSSFPKKVFPKKKKSSRQKILSPFKFNPNEANKTTLLALGLSNKLVQTILNYRNTGAQFREKEDFKKIYGLTTADYLTLAPFIEIPKKAPLTTNEIKYPKNIPQHYNKTSSIKIDINNSKLEDWKRLKGIGDITAKRILNYRDKLGGFLSIEQLKTTYNVPDSTIDKVAHQLIISPIPHKIAINTVLAETLKLHPYITKKQAYLIVNYRTNHGNYVQLKDLEKVKALSPGFIQRIAPYLSFE